ncbi:hypothetical protein CVT26_012072 [Gymnopilus dilepis]|uniref:Uncharacterized protein n=1 Tax=Gymnopilus dilepis TaxID=231916 RepID=A0A409W974_9AGAR|nr:hypothetical protein CVT26_012072 [Gymnopilus dilepis]
MFKLALAFVFTASVLQRVVAHPVGEGRTDLAIRKSDGNNGLEVWEVRDEKIEADAAEFIGFHGTNSKTAKFWMDQGYISKPPGSGGGGSGADAELGPGLYVTDDPQIALAFANNNAQVNPGTTPKVCAISSRSSDNWRIAIKKVFIPEKQTGIDLIGDSANAAIKQKYENRRTKYINLVRPGVQASTTVRFSLFDRTRKTGQLVLPDLTTQFFSANCFTFDGHTLPDGTSGFPDFSYNSQTLRQRWDISAEDLAKARTATAAYP